MTKREIETLVDPILRNALVSTGFERAVVSVGTNYEGEDSLFIDAHFGPGALAGTDRPTMQVMGELRRALLDAGETRFPYLEYVFEERSVESGDGVQLR